MTTTERPRARCLKCGHEGPIVVRGNLSKDLPRKSFKPWCGLFYPGRFVTLPEEGDRAICCPCGSYDVEAIGKGTARLVVEALELGLDPMVRVLRGRWNRRRTVSM